MRTYTQTMMSRQEYDANYTAKPCAMLTTANRRCYPCMSNRLELLLIEE